MRKVALFFVAILIFPALVAAGGRKQEEVPAEPPVVEPQAEPVPVEPSSGTLLDTSDPEKYIAVVNGVGILRSEFELRLEQTVQAYMMQGTPVPPADMVVLEEGLLDQLVATELLYQEALLRGLEPDTQAAELQFQQTRAQFPTEEAWDQALALNSVTEEELREQLLRGNIIQQIVEVALAAIEPVTQEEIQTFYDENPAYFETAEQVTASHILISTDSLTTDEEKADALARTQAIREELIEGADFATMAQEKSEGPSGPRGGDLGTFGRGQMVGPFEEAAFALEPGVISEIVETQFGYHIILVTDKQQADLAPIEDVSPSIEQFLSSQKQDVALSTYVDDLRDSAEVVLNN
jgi:peptidyl-prolyl cis-trans isomerase C